MTPDEIKAICSYLILVTTACNIFILGAIAGRRLLILDLVPNYKGEKNEKYGDTLLTAGATFLIGCIVLLVVIHFL